MKTEFEVILDVSIDDVNTKLASWSGAVFGDVMTVHGVQYRI